MGTDRYGNASMLQGPLNPADIHSRAIDPLSYQDFIPEDQGGKGSSMTDMTGPTHTSKDVREAQAMTSFSNPATQKAATTVLGMALPGIAQVYGAFQMGLGTIASTMESFEGGFLGDVTDSRTDEGKRDRAENVGYSYGSTRDAAEVDTNRADRASISRDLGFNVDIDPGLSRAGVGISPGLNDLDPYGGYSGSLGDPSDLGDIAGFGTESPGFGLDSDISGRSSISDVDPTSRGGYSASLGDTASGGNGGDSTGGESGGHGERGGGDEGDSSPGGIGGY